MTLSMNNQQAYDRAYREANRAKLNQKRRERRRSNPAIKAKEKAYRDENYEKTSLYRRKNRERRIIDKRAYRRSRPSEAIGYAHRTNRDLVRSGVLSLSVMRDGGNEITDGRLSVLDELIASEEAA